MMEIWVRNSDDKDFKSMEDAYQDYRCNEDTEYLLDTLYEDEFIDPYDLFKWAVEQQEFWKAFQYEITRARETCFNELYREDNE